MNLCCKYSPWSLPYSSVALLLQGIFCFLNKVLCCLLHFPDRRYCKSQGRFLQLKLSCFRKIELVRGPIWYYALISMKSNSA
uniref:Putative ovule protein n=1 Tax=Solanum chacoense TaxID=4108 RepID=A0A0V0HQ41_SOLCH